MFLEVMELYLYPVLLEAHVWCIGIDDKGPWWFRNCICILCFWPGGLCWAAGEGTVVRHYWPYATNTSSIAQTDSKQLIVNICQWCMQISNQTAPAKSWSLSWHLQYMSHHFFYVAVHFNLPAAAALGMNNGLGLAATNHQVVNLVLFDRNIN